MENSVLSTPVSLQGVASMSVRVVRTFNRVGALLLPLYANATMRAVPHKWFKAVKKRFG
jgi:hypothetical protein